MRTRGPRTALELVWVEAGAAYTGRMNTVFWRAVIAALLALALPLQALAGLRLCGMAAGPAMAPVAVEASAPKAAPEALPPCHEMAAADEDVASDSADASADPETGTRCSACAASACCHALALLPSLPSLRLQSQAMAPVCAPAAARERMLTGGLDRPPRSA